RQVAGARLNQLRGQGMSEARLYGDKEYGGLHALFLLTDAPEAYGLPNTENAVLPSRNNMRSYLGSLVTAALGIVGAVFAFRDLGRPLRFWHMLIDSRTFGLNFKYWSPMSVGAWVLIIFSLFAFVSFLEALGSLRGARAPFLSGGLGRVFMIIGAFFGLFLAG